MNSNIKSILITLTVLVSTVLIFFVAYKFFAPSRPDTEVIEEEEVLEDTASTLLVSEDAGITWRGISGIRFQAGDIVPDRRTGFIYAGTLQDGIWVSKDTGKYFYQIVSKEISELVTGSVQDIKLERGPEAGVVVAITYRGRGRIIRIRGDDIQELYFSPLENIPVSEIVIDGADPEHIYFVSGNGFFGSTDAGATWRVIHRFRNNAISLIQDTETQGRLWATTARGEVFRTTSYGEEWADISQSIRSFKGSRDNQELLYDPFIKGLYLISDHGLLVSYDYGDTWASLPLIIPPDSLPISDLVIDPGNSQVLYVAAAAQLYKSTDGGISWRGIEFASGLLIRTLALDSQNPRKIYAAFGAAVPRRRGFSSPF